MSQMEVDQSQLNETVEPKKELDSNQVRKALRATREEMQENRLNYIDPNSNQIELALERVERIFDSIEQPREAVSEAAVLLELAVLNQERIRNVACSFRSFNNIDFMGKLKQHMLSFDKRGSNSIIQEEDQDDEMDHDDDEEEDTKPTQSRRRQTTKSNKSDYVLTKPIIEKFGDKCLKYFRVLPRPRFLLGSLEKELALAKDKKVRQKKVQNKEAIESVRTKIKELDANSDDNETNNTVGETERIYELLKKIFKKITKGNPLCLYEFMINPHSFSRTIENIFYISFLVKDGYAKIYLDGDKLPVIEPIEKEFRSNDKSNQKKTTDNIQSMISMSKPEWRELIEVFGIENALIPDPK